METKTRKRFTPNGPDGQSFTRNAWNRYWNGLTDEERQTLKDKARQEHASLSAVAIGWGA